MRASTLFAITLSVLLGLGAVAGARYAGLFDKKEPPPTLPEKPPTVRVLVPLTYLYAGIPVNQDTVMVKDLQMSLDEQKKYRFLPGFPSAVQFRIPKRNVAPSDMTPLTEDMFQPHDLPRSISERLEPKTAAVNVAVSKARSIGGTIRPDEYVDVWLTTKFTVGTGRQAIERVVQACIAKDCKVLMKRNSIWGGMGIDPDNMPVNFTLQANPYRAALIEYVQGKGELTLKPTFPPTAKATGSFNRLDSPEFADDDTKVDRINRGEWVLNDTDLLRVFKIQVPIAPPPAPPPPPPIMTRVIYGTEQAGAALFNPSGKGPYEGPAAANAAAPAQGGGASPAVGSVPAQVGQPVQQQTLPYMFGNRSGKQTAEECENCGK